MEKLPRNLRLATIGGILAIAVVSYVVHDATLPSTPASSSGTQSDSSVTPQQNTRPQDANQSSSTERFAQMPGAPSAPRAQKPERLPEPSAADQKVMRETLQKIRELLGNAEFDNAKLLDERTHPSKIQDKILEVPPVSKQSVQEAYAELRRALDTFPSDSRLVEELQTEALRTIASFTDRPKPIKVVLVQLQDEAAGKIYIVEFFVDDLKTVARDSEGRLSFRLGAGLGDAIVRDGYFKEGDGWAYNRYSHFFEEVP